MTRSRIAFLLALICLEPSSQTFARESPRELLADPGGIVIERLEEGSAAHVAGLRSGDVLRSWRRSPSAATELGPAGGELRTPFDLAEVELEQMPRGAIELAGSRGGDELRVELPPGVWKLSVRPRFAGDALVLYGQMEESLEASEAEEALRVAGELADLLRQGRGGVAASWVYLRLATGATEGRHRETAERAFGAALREAEASGEDLAVSEITHAWAAFHRDRSDFDQAEARFREAMELRRARSGESLAIADSLNSLGSVGFYRGDLDTAVDFFRRALELRERLAPGSVLVATSLNNLGGVAFYRGDLATAESYFGRSLELRERLAPDSADVAMSLNNLSLIANNRGDLATSESYCRRAMAIQEVVAPESLDMARYVNNLANVLADRGDLDAAEAAYRLALELQLRHASKSADAARLLNNLGLLASERGDVSAAEEHFRAALEMLEELVPGTLDEAMGLTNLGRALLNRGDLERAEATLRRASAIQGKEAPRGYAQSASLRLLGDVALARNDHESAMALYRRSLAIRRERAPGSAVLADACQRIAALHRRLGELDEALRYYTCAVEALEDQKVKLGGSDEARSGFAAKVAGTYRQAIDLLVEMGKAAEAFRLLERSRARELLALLAGRDLVFSSDLPAELEQRRRVADQAYERAFGEWMGLSGEIGDEQRQASRQALEEARRRQDEIRAEVRSASPRLAALRYPEPLDAKGAAAALDPGTLLLSYSVGEDRGHLFVLGADADPPRAVSLPIGEADLREEVEGFRAALARGRVDRRPEKVWLRARSLSDRLLQPVAAEIA
ncbi:MAG: tetratricopeptide repeat protein, partial [Holophagales bacterium]|nr:tetratricopeptide repeat protein [Holophagales bacterium]